MSKPTPGKQYIITADDKTLESIAARAYGNPAEWVRILNANQSTLNTQNLEDIVLGQVINIPIIPENEIFKTTSRELQLANKEPDEVTVTVGGRELSIDGIRIFKAMDNASHGWAFNMAWQLGDDPTIDKLVLPFTYPKAAVYIGGKLKVNGLIYGVEPNLENDSSIILEGWSFTADVIDSNLKPPYERAKITLKDLAEELVKPFGINVIYDVEGDEFFDRVTAGSKETIFQHLAKYARQRGVLITATPSGDLLFTKSNKGKSVGTLEEGKPGILSFKAKYDGRSRFSIYKGIGQSPFSVSKSAIAEDNIVPRSRFKTVTVNDTTDGNIQKAVDWARSKALADALTIPIPVSGFFAPDGSIWENNTLLTVISPTLFVPKGFTFLIRAVEYIEDNNGKSAILSVVPPNVYTGEPLDDIWSIA